MEGNASHTIYMFCITKPLFRCTRRAEQECRDRLTPFCVNMFVCTAENRTAHHKLNTFVLTFKHDFHGTFPPFTNWVEDMSDESSFRSRTYSSSLLRELAGAIFLGWLSIRDIYGQVKKMRQKIRKPNASRKLQKYQNIDGFAHAFQSLCISGGGETSTTQIKLHVRLSTFGSEIAEYLDNNFCISGQFDYRLSAIGSVCVARCVFDLSERQTPRQTHGYMT